MNKPMNTDQDTSRGAPWSNPADGPTLLSAVARHWGLVLLVTAAWCAAAGVFLKFTPWLYTSTAKLSVEPAGPRLLASDERPPARSAGYVAQQCEVIKSAPVLGDTLRRLEPDDRSALALSGDLVEFLKANLDVSVNKKDDIITIGFDSPDPKRGERVVDAVVATYLDHRSWQQQDTSKAVLGILQRELAAREAELAAKQKALVTLNQEAGLAWADERGDLAAQQLGRLYEALSRSEMASLDAQATYEAAKALAHDPVRLRLFAESQGVGDRQAAPDPVQAQLLVERNRLEIQLASLRLELSDEHPSVMDLKARLDVIALQLDQVAQQTSGAAEQYLDVLRQRLEVARTREASIRRDLQQQQETGKQSNVNLARRAMLQAETGQAQRLCDFIRSRIMETSAAQQAGAMDVQIIEPVFTGSLPTSPKIGVYLAAFGGVGLVLGSLLALRRQRRRALAAASDARAAATLVLPAPASPEAKVGQLAEEPEEVAARNN